MSNSPTPSHTDAQPSRKRRFIDILFRFQSYFGLIIIFVLAILFSPERDGVNLFLSSRNLLNVLMFASETAILAVGMTLVILVGGIDLSVGSVMALIGVISADLLMNTYNFSLFGVPLTVGPWPAGLIVAICIIVGAFIGFFNGWTAEHFKVPSFVTTLAMLSIARGLARVWAGNNSIPIAYDTGSTLSQYSSGSFGDPLFGCSAAPYLALVFPCPR